MLCLQPVSHVHLDVSEAPQAGWHCMDSRTCNGISSLTPQAPHLQDDVPCHPVLVQKPGSRAWLPHALYTSHLTPQLAMPSVSKSVLESSSQSLLPPPKSKSPPQVTQTLQRHPPHPQLFFLLPLLPSLQPNPFSTEHQQGAMETKPSPAPSLFIGSLAPDLAADRVGVLSQGVASSSELSRGCLEATYMAM